MKLIIGLGNPGKQYERTRHNAGFLAIDYYLKDKSAITCQSKFNAQICELHYGGTKVFFVKPETFMNLSGEAVQEISHFYKVNPADILIIHDEVDLSLGKIRIANDSSAGGHNGIQDIINKLGTQTLRRVRVGIETRENRTDMPTDAFVLQKFSNDQLKQLDEEVLPQVNEEIEKFIFIV